MIEADVEALLREAIGLNAESLGASALPYAVSQRMAAGGFTDAGDYWRALTRSREELQELINAVIIPETWFFRDREAFAAMVRHAEARRRGGAPVQMLSLPCSSGEEPFSMAMAMFDAGFAPADFTIDAVDVSTRNIANAQRALYGRNSFRGADLAFRARHFEAADGGHRPTAMVINQVRFRAGNLFDPAAEPGSYDVVFCRNLLIYFDRALQERALARLRQLLVPQGLLLVGPAESSLPTLHGFASVRSPMAFAFFRQDLPSVAQPLTAARPGPVPPPRRPLKPRPLPPPWLAPPATPAPPPPDPAQESLRNLEQAANQGRLEEARRAGRRHLDSFGPSAAVFYLIGLAHDADNAVAEASDHYRRALYLDPQHRESLAHLALLLERSGDKAGAKVLKSRLGRLEKRSGAG